MLRWIDIPPFWLLVALAGAVAIDRALPGWGFGLTWTVWLGYGLVAAGLALMVAAVAQFLAARTSFIPRRRPEAFLKSGIYRLTRNPIYLGDALVLTGVIVILDAPVALILVPLFGWFITRRFIRGEEAGLVAAFGDEAHAYMAQVRRWL
ncbi:isoprenylcysteine carboxylmethyltransferase family protein [Maritimibacter sp. UBA3975]|uniref:methyltransferase family protein n=1 Tax=Maritimibacter sp. UBA3975 TaxID=1946833 RepID=UPI0025B8D9F0|nr:isoprenylcysteine carboxylmethyltransferase family protein [Maritimibacter sp. UBA3975]